MPSASRVYWVPTIAAEEVENILQGLGLSLLERDQDSWQFQVPSWRFDLAIEVDLIEEIARIHGYDKLPRSTAPGLGKLQRASELSVSFRRLRNSLNSYGYQEVISYSFVNPELEKQLALAGQEVIPLSNPISADMSVMRRNLCRVC